MKKELAEALLAKIMDWSDREKAQERARLETFASYKYDEYLQFSPGRRFIESLALWLGQFQPGDERRTAYDFVSRRLIFFSASEINLVLPRIYGHCYAAVAAGWNAAAFCSGVRYPSDECNRREL